MTYGAFGLNVVVQISKKLFQPSIQTNGFTTLSSTTTNDFV